MSYTSSSFSSADNALQTLLLRVAGMWGPHAEARVRLEPRVDDDFLIERVCVEVRSGDGSPWQALQLSVDAATARAEVARFSQQQHRRRHLAQEATMPSVHRGSVC
jgi:hypothetical protein